MTVSKFILLLVLLVVFVSGCEQISKVQNPLVGNWITTVPLIGVQEVMTIQPDNTIYFNNPFDGMRIYSYEIVGGTIKLTNLDTGQTEERSFRIIGDYKAIKIKDFVYYPYTE